MTKLQVCVAAVIAVLLCSCPGEARGRRRPTAREEVMVDGDHADLGAQGESSGTSGGLTVQEPPAGWPLSELRAYEYAPDTPYSSYGLRQHRQHRQHVVDLDSVQSGSEPQPRWHGVRDGVVGADSDQLQVASLPGPWYSEGLLQAPRQGRILAAHSEPQRPSAPPALADGDQYQHQAQVQPQAMAYFTEGDSRDAASSDAGLSAQPATWQPSQARYKGRKRIKATKQEQQPEQQQQDEQQPQQQHQQLSPQQDVQEEHQLQHEPPPVDLKKRKKVMKRVNKRKPTQQGVQQGVHQGVHQGVQQGALQNVPQPEAGSDTAVNVGYSIGFAADAPSGPSGPSGPQEGTRNVAGDSDDRRGSHSEQNAAVQGEVVHGEGAVSYSSSQLGNKGGNVVSSSAINGRPIYVAPLPQVSPSGPGYQLQQLHQFQPLQALPTPQALVGGHGPLQAFTLVAAPAAGPVVSTTPSYVIRTPHTIYGSSSTKSDFNLAAPAGVALKPPKAVSTVLHINDGTDFKWHDVGNGVEVSAPITANGLRGGYRDSIPIIEDPVDEDAGLASNSAHFDHDHALGHSAPFDQTNAVLGETTTAQYEQPSNHIADPHAQRPHRPDPFKGLTSGSFVDFMKAYTSTSPLGRHPHSSGTIIGRPSLLSTPTVTPVSASPLGPLGDSTFLGSIGKLYYLPSDKPGGEPIPAVIMPLSKLRELQAGLASTPRPVVDVPPPDHHGDEQSFKLTSFKTSSAGLTEASFPPHLGDHRVPAKYRPTSYGKAVKEGFSTSGRRPQSYKQHGARYPGGAASVKIVKSVPLYEQHGGKLNGPVGSGNAPTPALQWPPRETVEVQTFLMPIEQFESLKSNVVVQGVPSNAGHSGSHGSHGPHPHQHSIRPAGNAQRDVVRGRPSSASSAPSRPVRAHQPAHQVPHQLAQQSAHQSVHQSYQAHQASPTHQPHQTQLAQLAQLEPGSYAVSSSYRVRGSSG